MSKHVDKLPEGHPYRLFRNFLKVVWLHLGMPEPTAIQNDFGLSDNAANRSTSSLSDRHNRVTIFAGQICT